MDRHRARRRPAAAGTARRPLRRRPQRSTAAPAVATAVAVVLTVGGLAGVAGAVGGPGSTTTGPTRATTTVPAAAPVPPRTSAPLTLLSQSPWVTPGSLLDLQLRPGTGQPPLARLAVTADLYPCLSTLSALDQSVTAGPQVAPMSVTPTAVPLGGLSPVPGGGVDLQLAVVEGVGDVPAGSPAGSATLHLLRSGQCQQDPSGVYPLRLQLEDTARGAIVGSLTTEVVFTLAPATTERLRVAVVLPLAVPVRAAPGIGRAALRADPGRAVAPDPADLARAADVLAQIGRHPAVPVTLQASGQTVAALTDGRHPDAAAALSQLVADPADHELTPATWAPVDATSLVGGGLGGELGRQLARGGAAVTAAGAGGLVGGVWVASGPLDAATLGALAGAGDRRVVLPAADVVSPPTDGSTARTFSLTGVRGGPWSAIAASADVTAHVDVDPLDPVLDAHLVLATLAQLYYEQPNDDTPRMVVVLPPAGWTPSPAFVDALLGGLDGNPSLQATTVAGLFDAFTATSPCRGPSGCRLDGPGAPSVPVRAVRAARAAVDSFDAATGRPSPAAALGDLVLAGESALLGTGQQLAVLAGAHAALDAQLAELTVQDESITLTSQGGSVGVAVHSDLPYRVDGVLTLTSDKLLFASAGHGWLTAWRGDVALAPRRLTVVTVQVRARASGDFRIGIVLRAPDGHLVLASGGLTVRSTATSVVGIALTVGAVAVLVVWWVRTSRRRRSATGETS